MPNDKLQKLQQLIEMANDGLTKDEFLANFKIVIDLVNKLKAQHTEALSTLDTKYSQVVDDVRSQSEGEIEKSKNDAINYLKTELEKANKLIAKKLAEVKDGEPGKDADVNEVALKASTMAQEALKPLIPTIEQIENDLPKLGSQIRDGLELLQEEDKLKIEDIYELREELDKLKKMIGSQGVTYVGGGGSGGRIVKAYDLSSVLNGSTKTFSLPAFWRVISVHSSSFPNAFRPTVDYTTDAGASTITFTSEIEASSTLATGQTLTIIYSE